MKAGYHVLLEKPMAPDAAEIIAIGDTADAMGTTLVVCHVLRYTKFFMQLKELLESGIIGKLITLNYSENVGFFHQAHSFVRGNWRQSDATSPMIVQKCCHDTEIGRAHV